MGALMADPNTHKGKFLEHCVQEAKDVLEAEKLRKEWKPGYLEHTAAKDETIYTIPQKYADKAPEGFDWKWLCRFNWGTIYPPFINWMLIKAFDFDENKNLKKDKMTYLFKGGEKIYIPKRPTYSKPGKVGLFFRNLFNLTSIYVTSVHGPCLMTPGIESTFKVAGYSAPRDQVTEKTKKAIKWKIKNLKKGSEKDLPKTGETLKHTFADANVGDTIRLYPYINKINEFVYAEVRVIKVEFKHEIAIGQIDDAKIEKTDPINKIHNPAAVIIGAGDKDTAARFRLTKVEPSNFHLAPNACCFKWKSNNAQGEAKFISLDGTMQNTGSQCIVEGVKPGYIILEGWTAEAKEACVWMTLKVVKEREIPYRVNLFQRPTAGAIQKTKFTSEQVSEAMTMANMHLRQIGLKLIPDSDKTAGEYLITGTMGIVSYRKDNAEAVTGHPGHFKIKKVRPKYFQNMPFADAQVSCCINSRAGVVNFCFAKSGDSAGTGGIAATGPVSNLLSRPKGHSIAPITNVPNTFKGPQEAVKPDEDANFKTIKDFDTPYSEPASKLRGGILIYDPSWNESRREQAAILAHEFGHIANLMHRGSGNTTSAGDDGIAPVSPLPNLMHPNHGLNKRTDVDLLQLEIFRASWITAASPGGLKVNPIFAGGKTKLTGAHNSEKELQVEVTRGTTRVANAFMNFFLLPQGTTDIQITDVSDWDPATRKASNGLVTIKVKMKGAAGKKAKILALAGENDDIAGTEIRCEIT